MKKAYPRIVSGCGIVGIMNEKGNRMNGDLVIRAMRVMDERSNGLGAGFAGYGIYPKYRDYYAFHLMFDDEKSEEQTTQHLDRNFYLQKDEAIPTKPSPQIGNAPILRRYFVEIKSDMLSGDGTTADDFVVRNVMEINSKIKGAFVMSSGKNMGVFKSVGFPGDIAEFFRIRDYDAYTWIGHGRFPTNTPGWWGGAHPFTILDYTVVHNGEISSYGINKRYLEGFGYKCTLMTDTEVMAYLFDLLLRKHNVPIEIACLALAAPFWSHIERMPEKKRKLLKAIRMVYGSALCNGPFAIILGHKDGMIGLNDRIKLRPQIAARDKDMVYLASEECAIREICPDPERIWSPKAGCPVIARLHF